MAFGRNRRAEADKARTGRLLDHVDQAFDNDAGEMALQDDDSFESIVLFGVAGDPAQQYPPPSHDYPRGR
ncbi:hypothetical protein [Streptomyces sp. G45]|uniref:hypothetical protein n=1 Tax=Streptomyces sp. G45 TaxID=3406627 RepID=UPI003C14C579